MLCILPDPRRRPHSQRHQGAHRILDVCSTAKAPGKVFHAEEWTARRLWARCSLLNPRRRQLSQSTGKISGSQERAARRPWVCGGLPDLRHLPHGKSTPENLRSPGAGSSTVPDVLQPHGSSEPADRSGAPGRSPEPRSGQLALLGALQPPVSSPPAARSETPESPPDSRYLPHGQDLQCPGAGSSPS